MIAHALATACAGVGLNYTEASSNAQAGVPARAVVLVDLSSVSHDAAMSAVGVALLLTPAVMTRTLLDALRRGASAVLTMDDDLDDLTDALAAVMRGAAHVSPSAARLLLDWHRTRRADHHQPLDLTLSAREQDVLRAMVDGLTIKGTARRLGVAVKTVEAHRRRLFDRLGVRTQTEAVTLALSHPSLLTSTPRSLG